MINKNPDPVAKRKNNSSVSSQHPSSLGDRPAFRSLQTKDLRGWPRTDLPARWPRRRKDGRFCATTEPQIKAFCPERRTVSAWGRCRLRGAAGGWAGAPRSAAGSGSGESVLVSHDIRHHAPLATRHSPPGSRHLPPATRFAPLTTRHPIPTTRPPSPATRHPPPATRIPSCIHTGGVRFVYLTVRLSLQALRTGALPPTWVTCRRSRRWGTGAPGRFRGSWRWWPARL